MARTALAPVTSSLAGTVVTFSAANVDGHSILNRGNQVLLVTNGSGGSINVTFVTPATVEELAVEDPVRAVAAGTTRVFGPWSQSTYSQQSGADEGTIYVNFSAVTSVTCAALTVPG